MCSFKQTIKYFETCRWIHNISSQTWNYSSYFGLCPWRICCKSMNPKFNSSPLKMDGWKMKIPFGNWGPAHFQGLWAMFVSFRECISPSTTLPPIIMVQSKVGVSPIGSLPFKYSHFPLPWLWEKEYNVWPLWDAIIRGPTPRLIASRAWRRCTHDLGQKQVFPWWAMGPRFMKNSTYKSDFDSWCFTDLRWRIISNYHD